MTNYLILKPTVIDKCPISFEKEQLFEGGWDCKHPFSRYAITKWTVACPLCRKPKHIGSPLFPTTIDIYEDCIHDKRARQRVIDADIAIKNSGRDKPEAVAFRVMEKAKKDYTDASKQFGPKSKIFTLMRSPHRSEKTEGAYRKRCLDFAYFNMRKAIMNYDKFVNRNIRLLEREKRFAQEQTSLGGAFKYLISK